MIRIYFADMDDREVSRDFPAGEAIDGAARLINAGFGLAWSSNRDIGHSAGFLAAIVARSDEL